MDQAAGNLLTLDAGGHIDSAARPMRKFLL
jgi:hypothetical protein